MKDIDRRSAVALGVASAVAPAVPRPAAAQTADAEAVRTANAAYYAAFSSRDIGAMAALWARSDSAAAVHPFSRAPAVGWAAVRRSYEEAFARFAEVSAAMGEPHIAVRQGVAWVVGTETLRGRRPSGEAANVTALATNVLERQGDGWLMVLHHASGTPPT
jgi:ketosteroid isomerase-like protein